MYKIKLTSEALRTINRLPDKVRGAVVETMRGPLTEHPRRIGKPLLYELTGLHSARRGDYRTIYQIVEESDEVRVLRVDHRRDAYRGH
jgi:mRNA interferase RelE/StbE